MDKENVDSQRMNKLVQSGIDRARDKSFVCNVPRMRTFGQRKFSSNPLSTINPNLISLNSLNSEDIIDFDAIPKKKTIKKSTKTKADPFEFIPSSGSSSPELSIKKSKAKSKSKHRTKILVISSDEEQEQLNNTIERNYYFNTNFEKIEYIPPSGMAFIPYNKKKKRKHTEVTNESELDKNLEPEILKGSNKIEQHSDDEFEFRRKEKEKKKQIIRETVPKEKAMQEKRVEREEEDEEFADKNLDEENINNLNTKKMKQSVKSSSSNRISLQEIHNKPSELNKRKQPVVQKVKRKKEIDKENIVN